MIITRTPLRISLIGGGTDLPAFYKKHLGAVVSMTIDKYVYVSVNRRFDGGYRVSYSRTENVTSVADIEHDLVRESLRMTAIQPGMEITSIADIPGNGTGLGSSSAFTVGLLHALLKDEEPGVLAERAFVVESEKCGHAVGKQDQYAAAYGGMNYMTFGKNGVGVRRLEISKAWKDDFENHALLLWTGSSRNSDLILKEQAAEMQKGSAALELSIILAKQANEFYEEFLSGVTVKRMAELIHAGWMTKRAIIPTITNAEIDDAYERALQAGAWGGKLLGAGGGGFLFVLAPKYIHARILETTGLRNMKIRIETEGSKVIYDSTAANII